MQGFVFSYEISHKNYFQEPKGFSLKSTTDNPFPNFPQIEAVEFKKAFFSTIGMPLRQSTGFVYPSENPDNQN